MRNEKYETPESRLYEQQRLNSLEMQPTAPRKTARPPYKIHRCSKAGRTLHTKKSGAAAVTPKGSSLKQKMIKQRWLQECVLILSRDTTANIKFCYLIPEHCVSVWVSQH